MTNYHAYLIRFWRDDDTTPWRVALILPKTGEQHSFASIERAFAFLTDRLAEQAAEPRNLHDAHN
jgi:hypothetical protein